MAVFGKRAPSNFIPINPDNTTSKDWVILLEAGTIVGPSPVRLRVARSTQEKKIVKRYGPLLNVKHFLEVEGYDPRIHAVYFCPQLYKYDPDNKLIPSPRRRNRRNNRTYSWEWSFRAAAMV